MCARDMVALCTKTSLCVGNSVFPERGFWSGFFACVMAAFEGAEARNVAGSASSRTFRRGCCAWTHQGCSMDPPRVLHGRVRRGECPDRDVTVGVQQMPCQSNHPMSPGTDGHPASCRDHHPPWTASLSTWQAMATVSLIVVTPRL